MSDSKHFRNVYVLTSYSVESGFELRSVYTSKAKVERAIDYAIEHYGHLDWSYKRLTVL